jgi:hypothetical protein
MTLFDDVKGKLGAAASFLNRFRFQGCPLLGGDCGGEEMPSQVETNPSRNESRTTDFRAASEVIVVTLGEDGTFIHLRSTERPAQHYYRKKQRRETRHNELPEQLQTEGLRSESMLKHANNKH